jgi:hypothetical protein
VINFEKLGSAMSISTFVRHLFHSPILRLAIITLIALAYSTPTFCGEIHDGFAKGQGAA